ncbi:MAG TPA: VWA domain-containing protein [Candidatus Acidoferrales bacterium]|nr:VWA domain-containing protein [Candidatus Acidoferrales bacterium]
MRAARFFLVLALFCTSAPAQAPPGPQQNPTSSPPAPSAGTPPQTSPAATQPAFASTAPIKTSTRLITIDVIATDSHGNTICGLTRDDLQVFDQRSGQQKLVRFEFIDTLANAKAAGAAPPRLPPYMFSNVQSVPMTLPPTVILMDALNTDIVKQMQVRRDMILFVKTLPPDTPVAVFLLGHTLHIVQNFTTDPSLLLAAVNQSGRSGVSGIVPMPQDDADNVSNSMQNFGTNTPESVIASIEDFEKEEYEMLLDERVKETADAMQAIAKFLGGYTGRKNLIWFSESFPIWIEPTTDFGSDPFMGSTSYSGKVREAAYALTDARVAVYPVDARALEGPSAFSASNPFNRQTLGGPGFAGALRREDSLRIDSQATMDEVAQDTGGITCKNTNDLAGCVKGALNQSSAYYELAYYPENAKWDGRFHKITVKTPQKGVKLSYRRGYFATDAAALAQKAKPDDLLKQSCRDALPGTAIAFTAQAVGPDKTTSQPDETRYILNIPVDSLSLNPFGGLRSLNIRLAICEYTPKGDSFHLFTRDLSRTVTEPVYESWKTHGMRDLFDYVAKPENQRLRFAVLDVPSGEIGAIDVPAHPQRYGGLPAPTVPGDPSARASAPASAVPPAAAAAAHPQTVMSSMTFKTTADKSSVLDWRSGMLSYHGDLGIELAAPAFFEKVVAVKYHCQAGTLVSNDADSRTAPKVAFEFHSPAGATAIVEMTGEAPGYSGNLPVDASATPFFDYVWKLCHCQQP